MSPDILRAHNAESLRCQADNNLLCRSRVNNIITCEGCPRAIYERSYKEAILCAVGQVLYCRGRCGCSTLCVVLAIEIAVYVVLSRACRCCPDEYCFSIACSYGQDGLAGNSRSCINNICTCKACPCAVYIRSYKESVLCAIGKILYCCGRCSCSTLCIVLAIEIAVYCVSGRALRCCPGQLYRCIACIYSQYRLIGCFRSCVNIVRCSEACPCAVYICSYKESVLSSICQTINCVGRCGCCTLCIVLAIEIAVYCISGSTIESCPVQRYFSIACLCSNYRLDGSLRSCVNIVRCSEACPYAVYVRSYEEAVLCAVGKILYCCGRCSCSTLCVVLAIEIAVYCVSGSTIEGCPVQRYFAIACLCSNYRLDGSLRSCVNIIRCGEA